MYWSHVAMQNNAQKAQQPADAVFCKRLGFCSLLRQAVRIHASILSFIHRYIHLPVLASTLASSTLAWAMVLSAACSLLGCHI